MVALSDEVASEHVQVMCLDPEWYHARLTNYGSLFLGAHTTVSMGDKASGPNHVLPTARSARFSSGLGVLDFVKRSTFVAADAKGLDALGPAAETLARAEGLDAHALSLRIRRSSPEKA